MNAYELAKQLEERHAPYEDDATNMLRQQADRIAELENKVKRLVGAEPITYGRLTFCKNCGQQDPYAQTKPLSDEEITNVFVECLLPDGEFDEHEFARAIEERHGIK